MENQTPITDVQKYTIKELTSPKYIWWSVIVIIAAVSVGYFFNPIWGLAVAFVYFGFISSQIQKKFMQNFALLNGFEFQDTLDLNTFSGKIFEVGHSKRAYNGAIGKYLEYPIRIFNYNYTVGSGKSSHTYHFTICEIEITKTQFPFILLKSHGIFDFDLLSRGRIKLEEEFDSEFDLYCTEDYEIETLQIFTPELLQFLKENGKHFNIEFSKNKINFYHDSIIGKKVKLDRLYEVVRKVLNKTGPLLNRLSDDFQVLDEVLKK